MSNAILAALFVLSHLPGPQRDADQAASILNTVAAVYRTARSCYLEANVTAEVKSSGFEGKMHSSFVWAVVPPARIRMEVKSMMMEVVIVSDGPNFWQYMPQSKQYTKKHSEAATITSRGIDSRDYISAKDEYARMMAVAVGVRIPNFEDIANGLKEARILSEEALEFNGSSVDCYVIETVHDSSAAAKDPPFRQTYWIDKTRFVVLRETHTSMRVGPDPDMAPGFTTTFTTVKINEPITDDLFVFVPPSGATEVKDFYGKDQAGKKR